jgi:hypothetical protein
MNSLLRGLVLSIILYVVVTILLIGVVMLCGGEFTRIPGYVFMGVGICTGIGASVINEKLD